MTSENNDGDSAYDVVGVFSAPGDVDCVLVETEGYFIAAWTALVNGQREIVAAQVRPQWAGAVSPKSRGKAVVEWVLPATQELNAHLPERLNALPPTLMRQLPVRLIMRERDARTRNMHAAFKALPDAKVSLTSADGTTHTALPQLRPSEVEHLIDALVFVAAVESGSRAPARAIADRRGISRRTAQGRIAKAEQLGFLTPVERGQINRRLTERAIKLQQDYARFADVGEEQGNG